MLNAAALYLRFAGAAIRSQAQYPASTMMLALAQFLGTIVEILAVWALFHRFGQVQGWAFGEVALFYGLINMAFALSETVTRGFDSFGTTFVRTGAFDRILLRPRSAAFQLMGHDFRLSRFGRVLQGLIVLVIGTRLTGLHWDAPALALAAWTVAGGIALFFGLFVLQATLAFWTVESLEVANVLTYGGVQAAQYPMSLYARWFRGLLTYVVPLACVAYFPVLAILGKPDPLGAPSWFGPLAPAAGFAFLALSFLAWRFGVGRYTSTGS